MSEPDDRVVDQVTRKLAYLEMHPEMTIKSGRDRIGRITFTATRTVQEDGEEVPVAVAESAELRELLDLLGAD